MAQSKSTFIRHQSILAVLLLCVGCQPAAAPPATSGGAAPSSTAKAPVAKRVVRIAAAADLKSALEELIREFHAEYAGFEVTTTFGASGNLYAQLSNKAPFDLFLSADLQFPRKLIKQGAALPDTEFQYAIGHLVVWVPTASALDVQNQGIEALLDPAAKKIAIANPAHAPYGRAAEAALKSLGVYDKVKDRLVLGENVAQTAQFIESGAADTGLISLSLAVAPAMKDKGRYWEVPATAHPPLEQGGVILKEAGDVDAAREFRSYLLSPEGRKTLEKFGFVAGS